MPELPRVDLIIKPTPLHPLPRLSKKLGADLWIKRDDLTGFALGGNKGRKIEYLIAEALRQKAEVIVTSGAAQSNFVRQLGAACAMFDIRCVAAVMHLPYFKAAGQPRGKALAHEGGNLPLDEILGVDVRVFPDGDWSTLEKHAESVAEEFESKGKVVLRIPTGGSSGLSAYAFFEAAREAENQAGKFDALVTPSSSGATHAGLAYYHHPNTRVVGVCADDDPEGELLRDVVKLCGELDKFTGLKKNLSAKDLEMRMEWVGEGYSIPSESGMKALQALARTEGIFLDPVYSSKAFASLIDMVKSRELGGRILFWHTGGMPTLFAIDP